MGAPDLDQLGKDLAAAEKAAASQAYQYADGPSYYEGRDQAQAAAQRARQLRARIAERTEAGAKLRQKIGIARRQLGTPDDAHEARVRRITAERARSTTDCTLEELRALLAEYQAAGFRVRPPRAAKRAPSAEQTDAQPLLRKIGALLADQKLPWTYAEAILRRQRGLGTAGIACPVERATGPELVALVAALTNRQRRLARQGADRG